MDDIMSKIRLWFKQRFCAHYHDKTPDGLPLFTPYPKKAILTPGWLTLRHASYKGLVDPEAKRCLNCGLYYFDTDRNGWLV